MRSHAYTTEYVEDMQAYIKRMESQVEEMERVIAEQAARIVDPMKSGSIPE